MTNEETQPLNIDSLLQPILECEPQNSWPLLLSKLIDSYPQSAELSYRVAVILEQIGALPESEKAYFHCLTLAPKNYLVYLYLGHLLEKRGEDSTALVCYTLCEALTGSFKRLQLANSTAPQTLERFQKAWQCMEKNLGTASSIESGRWVQYSSKPFETAQAPHLFYVANLSAHPIWPAEQFAWYESFNATIPDIIKEFHTTFSSASSHLTPYLSGKEYESAFPMLANSNNWQALSLFKEGVENVSVSKHFPILKKALEKVPCYGLTASPYEVFYSKLAKGQTITPHYGLSNHSLTVHLAIDIPHDCYLDVNGERASWQEHQLTIFDDSYLHMAHNGSDRDRIVLIFSIWHPDLTSTQRQAIQSEFKNRQRWIDNLNATLVQYRNDH
ncbi:aspartyl/asparaginyl beta-hydroxylase domain-containing protein [Pseudoalteromonas piscicida]|uniref:aspartyl/asparaginyl beta-hydroxylase domain-containing protein n=1 Tax=Pseudoalteromonas piscicida TaxID=43662 RepID=UPI0027E49C8E|nr:aspartyl/asparaginyl beta-hydroxylase domain-containing protein [Pseudoalteromonas piscicida]WMO16771.1 aspartyl/asparaginyl beta-hydroxylase domain-containing protein [Pseudoalteromonas piscicida]